MEKIAKMKTFKIGKRNAQFKAGKEVFADKASAHKFIEYDRKTHYVRIKKYVVDGIAIYKVFTRRK